MAVTIVSGGRILFTVFEVLDNLVKTKIIIINEDALRKNAAHGATDATIIPPTVGPITRPILLATALRVKAEGSSDLDTKLLMMGIIGVLIMVVPIPMAKVNIRSKMGVLM
jgi:hypothetical protein